MSLFERVKSKRLNIHEVKKSFPSGSFDPANQEGKFVKNESGKNLKNIKDLFIEIGLGNISPHLAAQNISMKKSFVKQKYDSFVSKLLGARANELIAIKVLRG